MTFVEVVGHAAGTHRAYILYGTAGIGEQCQERLTVAVSCSTEVAEGDGVAEGKNAEKSAVGDGGHICTW